MPTGADGRMPADLPRYRVFGLTLASDFGFETPLPRTDRAADLTFACSRASAEGDAEPTGPPSFRSRFSLPSGAPLLEVYRGERYDLIRYTEVADYRVSDDRITCRLLDPSYDFMIEIHLLGLVLAYWFERRGIPMLHASAVVVHGRAAVFVATNKGGKSSLACALMQRGHPLLSDDVVGLQLAEGGVEARSGFPSMRLWPDQAAHFHGAWEDLDLAHPREEKRRVAVGGAGGFGRFRDDPAPIGAFYVPDRRASDDPDGDSVRLEPVPAGEAVIELVRGSFLPRLVHDVGFARDRLALLGRIAAAIPMKRLSYPEGNRHLPRVSHVIAEDLRRGTGAEGGGR